MLLKQLLYNGSHDSKHISAFPVENNELCYTPYKGCDKALYEPMVVNIIALSKMINC